MPSPPAGPLGGSAPAAVDADLLAGPARELYQLFIRAPGTTVGDAAVELGLGADVDVVVKTLLDLSLLTVDGDGYRGVNPELAEAKSLGSEELELAARRTSLEQRRAAIRSAQTAWASGLSQTPRFGDVDVVEMQGDIANVLMHYAKECQDEILSVHPGRVNAPFNARTQLANAYSVNQGVRSRHIYQDAAMRDRPTRAYVDGMVEQGVKVRVAASLPGRSMVIDRQVALLPIPSADPSRRGLAVVRQPNVVAWVIATFEQLWAESIPFEEVLGGPQVDAEIDRTRNAILRLLAEGEKDEAISRRLAISVRTTRRHIAEYMSQVGATSRFQAGVIAVKTGHLDLGGG